MRILKTLIVLLVSVAYSWIFLIELIQISEAKSIGYLTMGISFLVNVSITCLIFFKSIDFLKKEHQKSQKYFLFKVFIAWAFTEWLVSLLAYLVWIGAEGSLDSVSPFASLAPTLAYTPLVYLTRLLGLHGFSAIFVTLGVALVLKKYRKQGYALAVLIIVLWGFSYLNWRGANGEIAKITLTAEKLAESQDIKTDSDIVILPEYGLDDFEAKGNRVFSDKEVFFVGSRQGYFNGGINNQFVFGSSKRGIISIKDKSRLIPAGEYLPYAVDWPLKIFRQRDTLSNFQTVRAVVRGQESAQAIKVNDTLTIGGAVCSSIVNPEDYRRMTKKGANVLTNSASLGIFGGSSVYEFQHVGMGHFHAVANARPFLQSTMDFPAFALDHNGHNLAMIDPINYKDLSIKTNNKKTLYTLVGDWAVGLGLLFFVWRLARWLRFERRVK